MCSDLTCGFCARNRQNITFHPASSAGYYCARETAFTQTCDKVQMGHLRAIKSRYFPLQPVSQGHNWRCATLPQSLCLSLPAAQAPQK